MHVVYVVLKNVSFSGKFQGLISLKSDEREGIWKGFYNKKNAAVRKP
jgi:hypothetical protein